MNINIPPGPPPEPTPFAPPNVYNFADVTRITVVGDEGRLLELWNVDVVTTLQDNGRTLKIFATKNENGSDGEDHFTLTSPTIIWDRPEDKGMHMEMPASMFDDDGPSWQTLIDPTVAEGAEPLDPDEDDDATYVEGVRLFNVHAPEKCAGEVCVVHNPLDHHMRFWRMVWRSDWGGFFERICPHGIGHPDPSQFDFWDKLGRHGMGVHGCDGCCRGAR